MIVEPRYSLRAIDDELRVFKYHALGNSYLIVDPRYINNHPELLCSLEDGGCLPASWLVKNLCSTSWGIGSNGLLFGPLRAADNAPFELSIINSDGTMAGLSGNGLRIFSKYLIDAGYVLNRRDETISIDVVEYSENSSTPTRNAAIVRIVDTVGPLFEVTINASPRFGPQAVGANMETVKQMAPENAQRSELWYSVAEISKLGYSATNSIKAWDSSAFLDIWIPHCVTFVNAPEYVPSMEVLQSLSDKLCPIAFRPLPAKQATAIFSQGCNLQWAYIESPSRIRLAIFERGEGPTASSGSSASAAAIAAFGRGLVESTVEVSMPGGTLTVHVKGTPDDIQGVTMIGSATRVFDGKIDLTEFVPESKGHPEETGY